MEDYENITDSASIVTATNQSLVDLDCPVYEDGDDLQVAKFSFWLEGVSQCCVAICGLIGNSISAFILSRLVTCLYVILLEGLRAIYTRFSLLRKIEK